MNLTKYKARYYRWRYDRLWKRARAMRRRDYRRDPENWTYKEVETYLGPRLEKRLENYGYKWWKYVQAAKNKGGFIDVTEKARLDANFSPKFGQAEFLKRQAVENHDVKSFWYPETEGLEKITEDTHTEISFAYCQNGYLHEYHNGEPVKRMHEQRISKHLTDRVARFSTVPSWLFGVKDKTVKVVDHG